MASIPPNAPCIVLSYPVYEHRFAREVPDAALDAGARWACALGPQSSYRSVFCSLKVLCSSASALALQRWIYFEKESVIHRLAAAIFNLSLGFEHHKEGQEVLFTDTLMLRVTVPPYPIEMPYCGSTVVVFSYIPLFCKSFSLGSLWRSSAFV